MKFSVEQQSFYADEMDYPNLPNDVVAITNEQYQDFYAAINTGHYIYGDNGSLVLSAVKPNSYYTWDGVNNTWVLTEDAQARQTADNASALEVLAASELARSSTQIAILQDKIDLQEYDTNETEAILSDEITLWRKYRIACNAVVKGTSSRLVTAPDAAQS